MLRFADGNIKKLAMIIGVDWSILEITSLIFY